MKPQLWVLWFQVENKNGNDILLRVVVTVSEIEVSHFNSLGLKPTFIRKNLLLTKNFKEL